MVTENLKAVTEEEKANDTRFAELKTKPEAERTEAEKTEFGELKTKYAGRAEKRIGVLSGKAKAAEAAEKAATERAEKAEKEAQELRDIQPAPAAPIVGNKTETIDIAGKKYFTDAALAAQIDAKEITEVAAIAYQAKRNEEQITVRVTDNIEKKQTKETVTKLRTADADKVLKDYPHFNKDHAEHNADDPLYKMTIELYNDGLGLKPDGLSKSVKRAKQILGIKDTPVDRSDDLGVEEGGAPVDKGGKKKEQEVPFTENEEDAAVSQFCQGDVLNPKTGRSYTRDEAIAAAKEAKRARRRA